MASVYKKFTAQDFAIIPFNAHKQYNFTSASAAANQVSQYTVNHTSESVSLYSSASSVYGSDSKNVIKYNQIDHLFYRDYKRKVGSKKNPNGNKEPPKKRGRKPKKKIVTNENPVFADDNINMEDLIIKLNNDKNDQENNLSFTIDEHEEINYNNKSKLCWNCSHDLFDRIHGVPINYNSGVFHTVGDFCSIECMARYAVDNMNDDIYNILPLINLYS